jgi:hypothetical protein
LVLADWLAEVDIQAAEVATVGRRVRDPKVGTVVDVAPDFA